MYNIEAVKQAADCRQYAAEVLGIKVGSDGRCAAVWRGGEREDSVQLRREGWFDHAENDHGSVLDLIMRFRGCDLPAAINEVAEYYNLQPDQLQADRKCVAEYDYLEPNGDFCFQVRRFEPGKKGKPKDFQQRHKDGAGNWVFNMQGVQRIPYNLPGWYGAEWVIINEGEKDADTLIQMDIPATSFPMGSGKIAPEYDYAKWFIDKRVIIIADNDPEGKFHADLVAWTLKDVAKQIQRLTISPKHKGDVTDWVRNEGGTREKLYERIVSCPVIDKKSIKKPAKQVTEKQAVARASNGKKSGGRPQVDYLALAREFGDQNSSDGYLKYKFYTGAWYRYDASCYRHMGEDDLKASVMTYLQDSRPGEASGNARRNVVDNLQSWNYSGVPSWIPMPCWMDEDYAAADGWLAMENKLINVRNAARRISGVSGIEPRDIERELTPSLFSTFGVHYEFSETAVCPKWQSYLDGAQPNKEDQRVLSMMFGLALIPETKYNVAFLLQGKAGTGKSVCLDVLRNMVGLENICCVPLADFGKQFATWPLTQRLLNLVGEMPTDDGRGGGMGALEGTFKDVTSGGIVPVEHKQQDRFEAPAIARCVFAMNDMPRFQDKSDGIWDRLRIMPFDVHFRNEDCENPDLTNEIVADELPGIFNWALLGLAELLKLKQFPEHSRGKQVKQTHREYCDPVGNYLNTHYQQTTAPAFLSSNQMFKEWQKYADMNGLYKGGNPAFQKTVYRVFGVESHRENCQGSRIRGYRGLMRQQGVDYEEEVAVDESPI